MQCINEGDVAAQKQREKVKSLPKRSTFQCRAPSCVHAYNHHVLHVPEVKTPQFEPFLTSLLANLTLAYKHTRSHF